MTLILFKVDHNFGEGFFGDGGDGGIRRWVADGNDDIGAFVGGALQDLGEETHRIRGVGKRGESSLVQAGEEQANGDAD